MQGILKGLRACVLGAAGGAVVCVMCVQQAVSGGRAQWSASGVPEFWVGIPVDLSVGWGGSRPSSLSGVWLTRAARSWNGLISVQKLNLDGQPIDIKFHNTPKRTGTHLSRPRPVDWCNVGLKWYPAAM